MFVRMGLGFNSALKMGDVGEAELVELCDMFIVHGVVDFFAGTTAFDDVRCAEDGELV